jgi:hypothetical protein
MKLEVFVLQIFVFLRDVTCAVGKGLLDTVFKWYTSQYCIRWQYMVVFVTDAPGRVSDSPTDKLHMPHALCGS